MSTKEREDCTYCGLRVWIFFLKYVIPKETNYMCIHMQARYYADEVKDKSGEVIDVSSWEQEFVEDLPEQENGFDCGVFMIKYADFYSRNIGLCFNQEHMQYFRLRTAKEILRLKAE
nr:ubiquitin-like-specific protease ESD4 [Ipomoea batatas]